VRPDTVLKWIKNGRLQAVRTARGHHRIAYRNLEPFLGALGAKQEVQPGSEGAPRPVRCWEFFSNQGVVRDACKECSAYRVRAAWCFEMLGMEKEAGHARLFCQDSCEDCAYYLRAKGLKIHVLVASAVIHGVRPAFAVVDQDLPPDGGKELVECLTTDSRVPGLKIILAVPGAGRRRRKDSAVGAIAVLVKPFGLDRLTAVVNRLPVESVVVTDRSR
jgi:hypothetical protein